MRMRTLTEPELAMIAGTRVMIGAGLGLLLAGRLERRSRRAVGWTLLAIGGISSIPLIAQVVLRSRRSGAPEPLEEGAAAHA